MTIIGQLVNLVLRKKNFSCQSLTKIFFESCKNSLFLYASATKLGGAINICLWRHCVLDNDASSSSSSNTAWLIPAIISQIIRRRRAADEYSAADLISDLCTGRPGDGLPAGHRALWVRAVRDKPPFINDLRIMNK